MICTRCKINKNNSRFGLSKLNTILTICLECIKGFRDKSRDRHQRRKRGEKGQVRIAPNPEDLILKKRKMCKNWYSRNKQQVQIKSRNWHKNNPKYMKNREKANPELRKRNRIRSLLSRAIKNGYTEKHSLYNIIGTDWDSVRIHLAKTWEKNYGIPYTGQKVHIDHIITCSKVKTMEEFLKLQHYTNLQYLTPEDNLKKGND